MKISQMIKKIEIKYPQFEWFYKDTKIPSICFGMDCNPIPDKFEDRTIGIGAHYKKSDWRLGMKFSATKCKNRIEKMSFECAEKIVNQFKLSLLRRKE